MNTVFTVIEGGHVFVPQDIGVADILICNDRIIGIGKNIVSDTLSSHAAIEKIHAHGKIVTPGIVDQHIHIIGGGGEGSFKTRTPEVMLGSLLQGGVTTVVGLLGMDSTTRSIENLLAKTKALREEGMMAYCLTGSYDYPSPTLTSSVKKDIVFINEVLGVKLALSDHRAPLIRKDELKQLASDVRVAGMLSGKNAYIKLHMGDGKQRVSLVREILEETEIPIMHFRPTHVGRCLHLFDEAMEFAKQGGIIDITAGDATNAISFSKLIELLKENDVPLTRVTMSSDGGGSWSHYDENGLLQKIGCFPYNTVHKTMQTLIQSNILGIEDAVSLATRNVARALGIPRGVLTHGGYADILILDENFEIETLLVGGKRGIENGTLKLKGTYE